MERHVKSWNNDCTKITSTAEKRGVCGDGLDLCVVGLQTGHGI